MENFTCQILFSRLLCEISVGRTDKQPVYKFPTFIPFLLEQYALSPEKCKNRIHNLPKSVSLLSKRYLLNTYNRYYIFLQKYSIHFGLTQVTEFTEVIMTKNSIALCYICSIALLNFLNLLTGF